VGPDRTVRPRESRQAPVILTDRDQVGPPPRKFLAVEQEIKHLKKAESSIRTKSAMLASAQHCRAATGELLGT
jgi:hypothetical protein